MRPMRIAFYGNFGDGNLWNEVTLQTARALAGCAARVHMYRSSPLRM